MVVVCEIWENLGFGLSHPIVWTHGHFLCLRIEKNSMYRYDHVRFRQSGSCLSFVSSLIRSKRLEEIKLPFGIIS